MNELETVKIEDLGDDLYKKVLHAIGFLMALDPSEDSPEGILLSDLADASIKYEKAKYGDFPEIFKLD